MKIGQDIIQAENSIDQIILNRIWCELMFSDFDGWTLYIHPLDESQAFSYMEEIGLI